MSRAARGARAALAGIAAALGLTAAACGAPGDTGPTGPDPVAVLALGDSITYGYTLGQDAAPGGYRGFLSLDLTRAGVAHRFVGTSVANPPDDPRLVPTDFAHDGWPGARIDEVRAGVEGSSDLDGGYWFTDTAARPALEPDVVVIHLGTNDIGQAYDPGTSYDGGYDDADPADRSLFASHLGTRLVGLVAALRERRPGVGVVVCTLVPMPGETDAAVDEVIRRDVLARIDLPDAPAVLADVAAGFPSDPGALADGIHPTASGYEAMAAVIAPAVEEVAARR